jgi:hypothetical protein
MSLAIGIRAVVITTFWGPILLDEEGISYRNQKRTKHTAGNFIASNRPRTTTN